MKDDQQSYRGWTIETYRARDEKGNDVGPWFCEFWYPGQPDRGGRKFKDSRRKTLIAKSKNLIDCIEIDRSQINV